MPSNTLIQMQQKDKVNWKLLPEMEGFKCLDRHCQNVFSHALISSSLSQTTHMHTHTLNCLCPRVNDIQRSISTLPFRVSADRVQWVSVEFGL